MSLTLRFTAFISLLFLSHCAILSSVQSPSSSYRSFLEDHVEEARLFDRGRELLSIKALYANEEMMKRQDELTPGFHYPYAADKDQIIIALDFATWERFSTEDVKVTLNGQPAKKILELVNPTQNEIHYPFAHPHYRIFYVNFDKQEAQNSYELSVQTLRGALKLSLKNR